MTPEPVELTVIIPVGRRRSDLAALYRDYQAGLARLGVPYECIVVLDGSCGDAAAALQAAASPGDRLTILSLTRSFGEATALMAGFRIARGRIIVTLPAYYQIDSGEIARLVRATATADLAVARRWPRAGGRFEAWRRELFHRLIASVTHLRFHDLGCGARAMRRRVLEEVTLYGDQHRFLPVLASHQGFRVVEIEVRQSPRDRLDRAYRPREYARRALDIFTVFFLVRFTKKPLRFFGMVGAVTFGIGGLLTAWLVIERLLFETELADRPALLLSSLLLVLGLQLFALGLLGELIIFTHARQIKDYQIDEVIEFGSAVPPGSQEPSGPQEPAGQLPRPSVPLADPKALAG